MGDVLRPDQPVPDDLGEAGDGGQGGLQLMADIGGEFPPEPVLLGVGLPDGADMLLDLGVLGGDPLGQGRQLRIDGGGVRLRRSMRLMGATMWRTARAARRTAAAMAQTSSTARGSAARLSM